MFQTPANCLFQGGVRVLCGESPDPRLPAFWIYAGRWALAQAPDCFPITQALGLAGGSKHDLLDLMYLR